MNINKIKIILIKTLMIDDIYIFDDNNHIQIIVISNKFINLSKIEQHKIVYSPLVPLINSNVIHSLTIKTYTNKEWLYVSKKKI